MRNTMRHWMVGIALLGGLLGAGTVAAKAAPLEFHERFVVGGYIPPCPGDGYVWTAGYFSGGYWVPGAWVFRGRPGFYGGYAYGGGYRFDRDRHFEGRRFDDRRGDDRRFEARRDDGHRFENRDGGRGERDFHGRR